MTLTFAMLGPRKCVTLHWPDCLLIHLQVHASDVSCRAVDQAPKQHVRDFDPSEPGSHRLLEEMSLVELRERLALVRRQQEVQPCFSLASENQSLLC